MYPMPQCELHELFLGICLLSPSLPASRGGLHHILMPPGAPPTGGLPSPTGLERDEPNAPVVRAFVYMPRSLVLLRLAHLLLLFVLLLCLPLLELLQINAPGRDRQVASGRCEQALVMPGALKMKDLSV